MFKNNLKEFNYSYYLIGFFTGNVRIYHDDDEVVNEEKPFDLNTLQFAITFDISKNNGEAMLLSFG